MSGVVAVVATGGASAVSVEELERLVADYQHLRGTAHEVAVEGCDRIRAARFGADGQSPGAAPAAPSWRLCTGRMHGGADAAPTALEDADGQFALVGYDAGSDEAVLANDPLGMHALYVVERPGRTYASTSAMALARHLRCPVSRIGMQGFLVSGYSFGERTPWEQVRRLEPGSCLVLGASAARERTYWRPAVESQVTGLPLDAAVDHAIEVARSTLAGRFADQEFSVDLTGGFDSRLLCVLLESAGVSFVTNTRRAMTPDDMDIAQELAAVKGWPWYDGTLPATWPLQLPAALPDALAWGDGQLEVLQLARVLEVHRRLAEQRPGLLSGGGGEHFQYYAWQPEFLGAGRSSRVHLGRWVDMIALKPVDDAVLVPGSRAEVRADFLERLDRRLEPYRAELNTTQLELLYAYKSTGHFGAYRGSDDCCLRAELPFYSKDIFTTALSLDHRHRNRHVLMRRMIERLDPAVAAVRTTKGGPATSWTPGTAHRFLPYYRNLGRKAINKLTGVTLGKPLLLPQSGFPWEQAAHASVLGSEPGNVLLDPGGLRLAPLLVSGGVEELVAGAMRAGFAGSSMLGRVLTAELALRRTDTSLDG